MHYFPALATVLLLATNSLCIAQTVHIPDHLSNADGSGSTWVSESEVNRGEIARWEAFPPAVAAKLREYLSRREPTEIDPALPLFDRLRAECLWIGIAGLGTPAPGSPPHHPGSMEELREQSSILVRGVVEDEKQGFLGIKPGTVYRVRIENISSLGDPPSQTQILVFYPEAMIRMGSHLFCSTDYRDFERPVVGSRILLFLDDALPTPPGILKPWSYRIVFELPSDHTHRISTPTLFRQEGEDGTRFSAIGAASSFDGLWSWAVGTQDGS